MNLIEFYILIIKALEKIGAPYMIVGAFGASAYGLNRATMDVDIIVDLRHEHCEKLAHEFPPSRYYADPDQMRESMEMGLMFNIIDAIGGGKADLVPLSREPEYVEAFNNRVRTTFQNPQGGTFVAWSARPSDIIVGKLIAWEEGQSSKHPNDIFTMLRFDAAGFNSKVLLDLGYIEKRAARISPRALQLWRGLVERAYKK